MSSILVYFKFTESYLRGTGISAWKWGMSKFLSEIATQRNFVGSRWINTRTTGIQLPVGS